LKAPGKPAALAMTLSRSLARSSRTSKYVPGVRGRASRPVVARRGSRGALDRSRGFSLLEVLVAFVVLALVGTALFRLFGGAMGNAGAADEWSRATLIAEARLAQASAADPLREATEAGTEDDGRIRWESKVVPWTPPDVTPEAQAAAETLPLRLYRISVTVYLPALPGKERVVALDTVRMGAKDPR
jgi:general secretion pathway protein I